jgi:hypothetical protein
MKEEKLLTPQQFKDLMALIQRNYAFGHGGKIKYIDPSFDMRDGKCFSINFRNGMHTEKRFTFRDVKDSMYNDIIVWLKDIHGDDKGEED